MSLLPATFKRRNHKCTLSCTPKTFLLISFPLQHCHPGSGCGTVEMAAVGLQPAHGTSSVASVGLEEPTPLASLALTISPQTHQRWGSRLGMGGPTGSPGEPLERWTNNAWGCCHEPPA